MNQIVILRSECSSFALLWICTILFLSFCWHNSIHTILKNNEWTLKTIDFFMIKISLMAQIWIINMEIDVVCVCMLCRSAVVPKNAVGTQGSWSVKFRGYIAVPSRCFMAGVRCSVSWCFVAGVRCEWVSCGKCSKWIRVIDTIMNKHAFGDESNSIKKVWFGIWNRVFLHVKQRPYRLLYNGIWNRSLKV